MTSTQASNQNSPQHREERPAPASRGPAPVSLYVNYAKSTRSRVVCICDCCGRRSKPVQPDEDGEPHFLEIPRGWSTAPYSHDVVHRDGSRGSFYTCPPCNRRLSAGESLTLRAYPAPQL